MNPRSVCKTVRRNLRRALRSVRFIVRHPLTHKNKAAGLWRYACFHLRHLILPQASTYPWVGGLTLLAGRGSGGVAGNLYVGLADFEEMGFLLHFLRPEDLFVDVGANVGVYTLLASGVCKSKAIAIEPIPATWKLLKEHLRINGLESLVEAYQVGIGSVPGTLFFTTDLGPLNRVATEAEVLRESEQVIPIPVITLDRLVRQRSVTCMKVDVEGYEAHVLAGAKETLSCETLKAIVIELCYNERCDLEAVHAMLTGKGFQPVRYDPFTRRFAPLKSFRRDQFNTLYVRDLGLVEQRVRDVPRVRVHGLEF